MLRAGLVIQPVQHGLGLATSALLAIAKVEATTEHQAALVRNKLVLAFGLLVGVAQAEGASRTPGIVRDVQCGYCNACTTLFTSGNGSIHGRRVTVSRGRLQTGAQSATASTAPSSPTTPPTSARSRSTSLRQVLIAFGLSVLGLLLTLPYVAIALLFLRRRNRFSQLA